MSTALEASEPSASFSTPPIRRFLIVTADDLGYAPERDAGIIKGYEEGIITQASLLVNGSSAESAVQLARHARRSSTHPLFPSSSSSSSDTGLPLGLHFNLTEGVCLHDGESVMLGKEGFWQATREGKITRDYVARELKAQMEAFRRLTGHEPNHIDGHNHIHVIPVVASVLYEYLPKLGTSLPTPMPMPIRIPIEDLDSDMPEPPAFTTKQRGFFEEILTHAKAAHSLWCEPTSSSNPASSSSSAPFVSSTHFLGLRLMGSSNTHAKLTHALTVLPIGVSEYMCHPGYASMIGDEFSRSHEREHELNLLCDKNILNTVKHQDIQLTHSQEYFSSEAVAITTATNGNRNVTLV